MTPEELKKASSEAYLKKKSFVEEGRALGIREVPSHSCALACVRPS